MNEVKFGELVLGDEIAAPIYTKEGSLLITQGTIVSHEIISKLRNHDIKFYKTLSQVQAEHPQENVLGEPEYKASVRAVKNVFEHVMTEEPIGVKARIPEDQVSMVVNVIEHMIDILNEKENLLYTITDLMDSDDYTYKHSVNVSILSILTAKAMHFSDEEIKDIALGALLHDIGKAKVKDQLVQKPAELDISEKEEMRKHPEYGYDLVKNMDDLPFSVKQIIRHHHEKMDGSGYPLGLKGMEIPKYVRLVTVCDMYDAMTTNRIYRKKMPIYTALEILMRDSVYKIDAEIYRKMTSTICLFPVGMGVMLSDGRVGIVSGYRHHNPTRPKVKVIDFNVRSSNIDVEEINLEEVHTLFIVDIWNVDEFKEQFDADSFNKLSTKEKDKYSSSLI